MLTESERKWLGRRNLFAGINFSCQWCDHFNVNREGFKTPCGAFIYGCPRVVMEGNDNDVEFEARVAAKLADFYHHTTLYLDDSDGQKLRCWETCPARFYCGDSYTHLTCGDAVLKAAQLAVEEEMDGNN